MEKYLEYRIRVLPSQLERARLRYEQLCAEARRYKLWDLLEENER